MTATTWRNNVGAAAISRSAWLARAPQIVTFLLALALAAQIALLLVGLAGGKQATTAPVMTPPAAAASVAVDVASIVNGHLFGQADTPSASGDAANAPSTTMALVLAGVLAADDPREGYAILGDSAASAKVVAVGEEISGGVKLHSVYADRAVIERAGALESVYLPQGTGVAGPPPPVTSAPTQTPLLDRMRSLVNEQPGALSQVIRPQPVFSQGKLKGFRVYPGLNRQAFSRLGLRAGDLVTAINGTPLDDQSRGEEIFGTLGSATDARITVTRNGRQQDLSLNLAQVAAEADALVGTQGMVPIDQSEPMPVPSDPQSMPGVPGPGNE
ncbi:MAG: type II secretion system protein GspC [Steroidobacteraceae bacterium]